MQFFSYEIPHLRSLVTWVVLAVSIDFYYLFGNTASYERRGHPGTGDT